ncbi:LacI family DNA-binding transcriptional regulator [Heyndrickxia sp. MSNUG]|uniref:LacI family DNA-binding transcriptional regulator n=1 Tax=Heyndrickxia sp. MSNUG TaxID=3136677 RepID=UPI003C3062BC
MANIREIARLAGVSVTTVSRVLNNHPYVSPTKREIVLKTIETLGYSRNLNAVHLSQGKTNMVGIVMPTINHPYFSGLLEGIAVEAKKHNVQLVLFQTDYTRDKELDALAQLRGGLIDGIIFCSRAIPFDILLQYKDSGPIILCEDADQQEFPSVSIEHVKAFNLGLDHLISKGHRKVAICLGRLEGTNSQKRIAAYKHKLKELGEMLCSDWILGQCLSIEDGNKVIAKYIEWDEKPTAFLVGNDQVAAGLISEANRIGLKVPDDIAVFSFDNHPVSEILNITTIEIPAKQLGIAAFNAFVEKSNHIDFADKIVLPFHLIERKSV